MAKSKFFRIATEGATTDGRVISRDWIKQMAAQYDPKLYGARINLEHYRGLLPDGPFKAYGDVVALKAEEVDGKLCLLAQIDPTAELIELSKKRQKIYTSMEVDPDFAKSGSAYLVGLAITDSPASLGTEMLQFCAQSGDKNPYASRKFRPENMFTSATETVIDFVADENTGDNLFSRITALLSRKDKNDDTRFHDHSQAIETVAQFQRESNDRITELRSKLNELLKLSDQLKTLTDAQTTDRNAFAALVQQLNLTSDGSKTRPPATGGSHAVLTDC